MLEAPSQFRLGPPPARPRSTASDVQYTDELPEDAELVEGSSLTASFRKLSVGSSVTHTYQMRFTKSRGSKILFLPHGKVTYTPEIGTKPQVGSGGYWRGGRPLCALCAAQEQEAQHTVLPLASRRSAGPPARASSCSHPCSS